MVPPTAAVGLSCLSAATGGVAGNNVKDSRWLSSIESKARVKYKSQVPLIHPIYTCYYARPPLMPARRVIAATDTIPFELVPEPNAKCL